GRPSLGVLADYVTNEEGTGLVHTAPSHGRDDYMTGQRYGLAVPNTVSESGVLTDEAGEFAGTYYSACDTVVTERLHEVGALLSIEDYSHSYPHAERDEKPVIYRATDQWFIAMDENGLRQTALAAVEDVQWIPPQGETRIRSMITNRPDWCVSRQRPWGVGIPILKTKDSGEPVLNPQVIESVAQLVEKHGSGAWLAANPYDFLHEEFEYQGEREFVQETDVLDVWFDSGSTAINVLARPVHPNWADEGVHYPADLYLEGSDQHRGWFNSSLLLGLATQGKAPYRTVVTHGMVVDEEGRKMSKRLGNVVDPVAVCERFGADVLRLWVATVDWTNDAACSMAILEQTGGLYRDLRNPLRFLVGNIDDLPVDDQTELLPIDRWILERCELLCADVVAAYQSYNLSSVASSIHLFCRDDLSRVYLDAIKDRMYCEAKDSALRRSGQRTCLLLAERLVLLLAPILPHTAEEVYGYLRPYLGSRVHDSIHERNFMAPDETRLTEIAASELQVRFAAAVELRETLNGAFEQWKGTDGIKAKKDAVATVPCTQEVGELLAQMPGEELAIFTGFSQIELTERVGDEQITLAASPYPECSRSRLRRADVQEFEYGGESVMLTSRDARVLGIS
ncbi:MAG: isoleucine--tRNA ligase, partial [Armatimonadota bacterium]